MTPAHSVFLLVCLGGCQRPDTTADDTAPATDTDPSGPWDDLPQGELIWQALGVGQSAAYADGRVYIGHAAVNATDGSYIWKAGDLLSVSDVSYGDGRVYASTTSGWRALDPGSGEPLWTESDPEFIPGDFPATPFGGDAYSQWRLDGETGDLIWQDLDIWGVVAVDAERVYAYTFPKDAEAFSWQVSAIARETGERVWNVPARTPTTDGRPCLDGDRVYASIYDGTTGAILALDAATGAEIWRFDDLLGADPDDGVPAGRLWSSPVVAHGTVYAVRIRERRTLIALDAHTGALRWWVAEDLVGSHPYHDVWLTAHGGELFMTGQVGTSGMGLLVYDASNGEPRWWHSMTGYSWPAIITDTGDVLGAGGLSAVLIRPPDL